MPENREVRIRAVPKGIGVTVRGAHDDAPTSYMKHYDGRWTCKVPPQPLYAVTDERMQAVLDALVDAYIELAEATP